MGAFDDVPFLDSKKNRGTFDDVPMVRDPVRRSDGAAQSFGQGVTFGAGDELTAAVRARFPGISDWMMRAPFDGKITAGPVKNIFTTPDDPQRGVSGIKGGETLYTPPQPSRAQTVSKAPTYDERYDEELARERQKMTDFREQNPVLATGSESAGNVAGGVALAYRYAYGGMQE